MYVVNRTISLNEEEEKIIIYLMETCRMKRHQVMKKALCIGLGFLQVNALEERSNDTRQPGYNRT